MAFKRSKRPKRDIQLVSFMDMIFILLIFYLVTSYVAQAKFKEKKFFFPTPRYELGRAEIFIQWIHPDQIFWIDQRSAETVQRLLDNYSYLSSDEQMRRVTEALRAHNVLDSRAFQSRLYALVEQANRDPRKKYFVVLRCPNELEYFHVMDAVSILSTAQYGNIEYGTIGGSFDDIRVRLVESVDPQGNIREVIQIDFLGEGS